MKTECTCVNCASLECNVRLECEDNELPSENIELETESADATIPVQVMVPKLAKKVVAENRFC